MAARLWWTQVEGDESRKRSNDGVRFPGMWCWNKRKIVVSRNGSKEETTSATGSHHKSGQSQLVPMKHREISQGTFSSIPCLLLLCTVPCKFTEVIITAQHCIHCNLMLPHTMQIYKWEVNLNTSDCSVLTVGNDSSQEGYICYTRA